MSGTYTIKSLWSENAAQAYPLIQAALPSVSLETGDRAAAIKMLIGVMEDIGRKFHCAAIHTTLPDAWIRAASNATTVLDHLRDAGHERETVKLSKTIPVTG